MQSGEFRIESAVPIEKLQKSDLIPLESMLDAWPRIEVSGGDEVKVRHGNQIPVESGGGLARIFNKRGEFIAVATVENGWVHPRLVLTSINSD
jgi:tRNA U55 pseudouridine synthase TruB